MNNEEVLNRLLSHACPSHELDEDWMVYNIDLHCVTVRVEARVWTEKCNADGSYDYSTYEVRSIEFEDS